jgi:hypothetical protein
MGDRTRTCTMSYSQSRRPANWPTPISYIVTLSGLEPELLTKMSLKPIVSTFHHKAFVPPVGLEPTIPFDARS